MSRDQLRGVGATREQIRHRLRVRRLHEIHPEVYSLQPRLRGQARHRAAAMACGSVAAVAGHAAAHLLGLRISSSARLEVVVPRGTGRRPRGVLVHETRSLPPEETTEVDGIPCTSWARTLVDCAATLSERDLDRMLERAMILRVFDRRELLAALARARGRRGVGKLRRLVARFGDPPPTRTEIERRCLELIRAYDLPEPIVNGMVEGHEVDLHWPDSKTIVEADGRETHDTPYGFERDHARDLTLELAGWHVIRLTWSQITGEPERVAALLRARLSAHDEDSRAA